MKPLIHATAGAISTLTILGFWMSTAIAEMFLSDEAVVAVKHAILYGLLVLVPAMVATGGSGFALASGQAGCLVECKKRRMRIIAANGLLIMVPAAFVLYSKAAAGEFDAVFYIVQAVELLMGIVQLILMGLNVRDGLKLVGRLRPVRP